MKIILALPLLTGLVLGPVAALAQMPATTASPVTRAQVKMDRDEFLKTHRWDEPTEVWVLKSGVEPPMGVKSRADVVAMRDQFLRNNRWDESRGGWQPLTGAPRDMSTMTREQVRAETKAFLDTHSWDEASEKWVARPTRRTTP